MKPAPIQLLEYFVPELHLSANPKFNAKQKVPLQFKHFRVTFDSTQNPKDKRDWQLTLKLHLEPPAEANIPYRVSATVVGSAIVHPNYPEERIERLVKTNGASMLYGALREIIRDTTARGPYSALMVPSASFYEPEKKAPKPPIEPPHPGPEPPKA